MQKIGLSFDITIFSIFVSLNINLLAVLNTAYSHAEFIEERKKMMQAWADYLDQLKITA